MWGEKGGGEGRRRGRDGLPDLSVELTVSDLDPHGQVPCQVDHWYYTTDAWNGRKHK